jgi:hypothetical protein
LLPLITLNPILIPLKHESEAGRKETRIALALPRIHPSVLDFTSNQRIVIAVSIKKDSYLTLG